MAQVDVTINGRNYQIACDDGQEAHLAQLGEYVDRRVKGLVAAVGQVGDSRLLVMVALLIADELAETYAQLKNAGEASADEAPAGPTAEEIEAQAVRALDAAAERIAALASEIGG
jgi:cell division protein ZapA